MFRNVLRQSHRTVSHQTLTHSSQCQTARCISGRVMAASAKCTSLSLLRSYSDDAVSNSRMRRSTPTNALMRFSYAGRAELEGTRWKLLQLRTRYVSRIQCSPWLYIDLITTSIFDVRYYRRAHVQRLPLPTENARERDAEQCPLLQLWTKYVPASRTSDRIRILFCLMFRR